MFSEQGYTEPDPLIKRGRNWETYTRHPSLVLQYYAALDQHNSEHVYIVRIKNEIVDEIKKCHSSELL
jgi:hypothetical protein